MRVWTDSQRCAKRFLPGLQEASFHSPKDFSGRYPLLFSTLFPSSRVWETTLQFDPPWSFLFVAEEAPCSQFDLLTRLTQGDKAVSSPSLFLAESGKGFHGLKSRPWITLSGNLHLCAYLRPGRKIEDFEKGVVALAAVSVVEAISSFPGLRSRAGIKRVNDILVDGFKVGGVLTQTHTRGEVLTSIVLGLGLNVEAAPHLQTTPGLPQASSLWERVGPRSDLTLSALFSAVSLALGRNYLFLLQEGVRPLLEKYRAYSLAHPSKKDS